MTDIFDSARKPRLTDEDYVAEKPTPELQSLYDRLELSIQDLTAMKRTVGTELLKRGTKP